MQNQVVTGLVSGTSEEAAQRLVGELKAKLDGQPVLLMVFASVDQPLSELMPPIVSAFPEAAILSASTCGEFTEQGDTTGQVSFFALRGDLKVRVGMGHHLKNDVQGAVESAIANVPQKLDGYPHRTALILLDTLTGKGEEASLLTSALLGEDVRLAGGAAGDNAMVQTWVGLGDQVASDALVTAVLFTKTALGVGVCHGHTPLSPPMTVTRSVANVVYEVDGAPAWNKWVEHTRTHSLGRGVDPEALEPGTEFLSYLVVYEAGLTIGDEYKVRVPLSRGEEGSLNFACGIPTGTVFRIMESQGEAQVESARKAAATAMAQLGEREAAGALVFDCVCRKAILGDRFISAVNLMSSVIAAPIAGFETLGEIALEVGEMSGFHNTTTVVLAFPRD